MTDNNGLQKPGKKECVWFFGVGASKACGLNWKEPDEFKKLDRETRAKCIKNKLSRAIKCGIRNGTINTMQYKKLLIIGVLI